MNYDFSMIVLKPFTLTLMAIIAIGITTSFAFAQSSEERPQANPEWGGDIYSSTDEALARINDPYMNKDPQKVEIVVGIIVVDDNYDEVIKVTLTETGADTGTFEANVQFTETGTTSGNVIRVAEGNEISLEYAYSEVIGSDELEDVIEIGDTITIQNSSIRSITLDRTVYPVPFGEINDFEDVVSSSPNGRSLFPIHATAITSGNIQEKDILDTGDLTLHIRINDSNFNVSENFDEIGNDINGKDVGPVKISVSRDSQTMVLAYAGGNTPNKNGLIDVGDNNPKDTRQLGPISEISPDSGIFELDLVLRYTDGPANSLCPATEMFTSLSDDARQGREKSRFDRTSPENENYCILKGDVLTVEYTAIGESGNTIVVSDTATFDLRNGKLESDQTVSIKGSDIILTLTDADLDLDNDVAETYPLDLIEWDSAAATLTMGELGGERSEFDPEPFNFRETGDSTGVFQIVIAFPQTLQNTNIERGEEVVLEYTDWSPSSANYVGEEDEDVNFTIFSSNFGATVELDQKVYSWTGKSYITIISPIHNLDSDAVDEIGATEPYTITVRTRDSSIDNYKLVETGTNTGIFTGEVILTGFSHDADGNAITGDVDNGGNDVNPATSGSGPVDGLLQSNNDDGLSVQFEFSEDETVVGSALIQWNTGEVQWLEASYPASGTGVVRVIDPDMNWDPEAVDNFDVDVWSDSDAGGIDLTVTETNEATGIFEGTVLFSTDDESSGHRLRVAEGDIITAEYEDNTLPAPYTIEDDLDVTDAATINSSVSQRASVEDL